MYDRVFDHDAVAVCAARFASNVEIDQNKQQAFICAVDIQAFDKCKCSSDPSVCPLLFNATYMSL